MKVQLVTSKHWLIKAMSTRKDYPFHNLTDRSNRSRCGNRNEVIDINQKYAPGDLLRRYPTFRFSEGNFWGADLVPNSYEVEKRKRY